MTYRDENGMELTGDEPSINGPSQSGLQEYEPSELTMTPPQEPEGPEQPEVYHPEIGAWVKDYGTPEAAQAALKANEAKGIVYQNPKTRETEIYKPNEGQTLEDVAGYINQKHGAPLSISPSDKEWVKTEELTKSVIDQPKIAADKSLTIDDYLKKSGAATASQSDVDKLLKARIDYAKKYIDILKHNQTISPDKRAEYEAGLNKTLENAKVNLTQYRYILNKDINNTINTLKTPATYKKLADNVKNKGEQAKENVDHLVKDAQDKVEVLRNTFFTTNPETNKLLDKQVVKAQKALGDIGEAIKNNTPKVINKSAYVAKQAYKNLAASQQDAFRIATDAKGNPLRDKDGHPVIINVQKQGNSLVISRTPVSNPYGALAMLIAAGIVSVVDYKVAQSRSRTKPASGSQFSTQPNVETKTPPFPLTAPEEKGLVVIPPSHTPPLPGKPQGKTEVHEIPKGYQVNPLTPEEGGLQYETFDTKSGSFEQEKLTHPKSGLKSGTAHESKPEKMSNISTISPTATTADRPDVMDLPFETTKTTSTRINEEAQKAYRLRIWQHEITRQREFRSTSKAIEKTISKNNSEIDALNAKLQATTRAETRQYRQNLQKQKMSHFANAIIVSEYLKSIQKSHGAESSQSQLSQVKQALKNSDLSPAMKDKVRDIIKQNEKVNAQNKDLTRNQDHTKPQEDTRENTRTNESEQTRTGGGAGTNTPTQSTTQEDTKEDTRQREKTKERVKENEGEGTTAKTLLKYKLQKELSEKEQVALIKSSGGATGWTQGELNGKPVNHIVTYAPTRAYVIVGEPPKNVRMFKGPGEAYKTLFLMRGSAPKEPIKVEGGIYDPVLSSKNGKVAISFQPDIPKRHRYNKHITQPKERNDLGGGIIEETRHGRKVRHVK